MARPPLKQLLNSIVDLPFAVSPVIGGLMIVLLARTGNGARRAIQLSGSRYRLRVAGHDHRDVVRYFSADRSRGDARLAGDRQPARGSRVDAWRKRLDDFLAGDLAIDPMERRVRRRADGRKGAGRIRSRARRIGEHH